MPSISLTVPHPLGKDAAREKLQRFMEVVKTDYSQVSDLHEEWQGDSLKFSFKTYGFVITGALQVREKDVVLDGTLPLAAIMFKGRVEQTIREQLERLLK